MKSKAKILQTVLFCKALLLNVLQKQLTQFLIFHLCAQKFNYEVEKCYLEKLTKFVSVRYLTNESN